MKRMGKRASRWLRAVKKGKREDKCISRANRSAAAAKDYQG
jgi:hypothetical protein